MVDPTLVNENLTLLKVKSHENNDMKLYTVSGKSKYIFILRKDISFFDLKIQNMKIYQND